METQTSLNVYLPATSITSRYNQIFGSPDQFVNNFSNFVQPRLDSFMGILVSVFLFTMVYRAFLK